MRDYSSEANISSGVILWILVFATNLVNAYPAFENSSSPTVTLDAGVFTGTISGNTSQFLGLPYGQPPIGNLRFNLPQPAAPYNGSYNVTTFGPSCPQQGIQLGNLSSLPASVSDFLVEYVAQSANTVQDEDCLNLNVVMPSFANSSSKLPVVVFIYGGAFEIGSASSYDGGVIVQGSINLNRPIVYVSMNYRLNAFGFLASQEVKEAGVGNVGLQDQRLAFRWVQKYIGALGGDPKRVTIWGQSAGGVSVGYQMLTNGGNTEGLFGAAFMESGFPLPVGDITNGQPYYDMIVSQTGCSASCDTLQCLREVPYAQIKAAADATRSIFNYTALNLVWMPRVDGVFLIDTPVRLIQTGSVADVPFITGECDDEGTAFSLSSLNVTTDDEFKQYIQDIYLLAAPTLEIEPLLSLYPSNVTQGSPYDTGTLNAVTPQSKRIASFEGDFWFQGPRRLFLQYRSGVQKGWSFLSKRSKSSEDLGSAHGTDMQSVYDATDVNSDLRGYLVQFVNNFDPNGQVGISWPQYTTASRQLLTLLDGSTPLTITEDNYRMEAISYLTELSFKYPM